MSLDLDDRVAAFREISSITFKAERQGNVEKCQFAHLVTQHEAVIIM